MEPVFVLVHTSVYSGATLLAFLLGAHPQVATVGEMNGMQDVDVDIYLCSCGQRIRECGFWQSVGIAMRNKGFVFDVAAFGTRFLSVGPSLVQRLQLGSFGVGNLDSIRDAIFPAWPGESRRLKKVVARNDALIEAVLDVTGGTVFVDTSKDGLRFQAMRRFSRFNMRAIHLVRDARGVAASRLRRGELGGDTCKVARRWVKLNRRYQRALQAMPEESHMRVRYEDLCQDPQGTLQELYHFLGIDPDVEVMDFRVTSHHIIGNAMRLGSLSEIRLDERWKSLLTAEQLKKIGQVAGKLSLHYGYDDIGSHGPISR